MRILERPGPLGVRPHLLEFRGTEPAYQAYSTLYVGYVALPIIAGLDKYADLLTNWGRYVSPLAVRLLGSGADEIMRAVGVIEIAAGVLVAVKPRWGALVVSLWLFGIIANLLSIPGYYDVALRDLGLALGALALFRLSRQYGD